MIVRICLLALGRCIVLLHAGERLVAGEIHQYGGCHVDGRVRTGDDTNEHRKGETAGYLTTEDEEDEQ